MVEAVFLELATPQLEALRNKYHMSEWWLYVEVVPKNQLSNPNHAAECHLQEPYRIATIKFSRQALKRLGEEEAWKILEHEVQHVLMHPLEHLLGLVKSVLPDDSLYPMLEQEFVRVNELMRSTIGRITKRGNNWE